MGARAWCWTRSPHYGHSQPVSLRFSKDNKICKLCDQLSLSPPYITGLRSKRSTIKAVTCPRSHKLNRHINRTCHAEYKRSYFGCRGGGSHTRPVRLSARRALGEYEIPHELNADPRLCLLDHVLCCRGARTLPVPELKARVPSANTTDLCVWCGPGTECLQDLQDLTNFTNEPPVRVSLSPRT